MNRQHLHLSLFHKALVLVSVPLAFELSLLVAIAWLWNYSEQESRIAARSKDAIEQTDKAKQDFFDASVSFITFNVKSLVYFQNRLDDLLGKIPGDVSRLKKQLSYNQSYLRVLDQVSAESEPALEYIKGAEVRIKNGGELKIAEGLLLQKRLNRIIHKLNYIIESEKAFQKRNPNAAETSKRLMLSLLLFGVATIFIALLMVILFHRSTSRRLSRLMENSVRLGQGMELTAALNGKDEIALIDHTFHEAASALKEAARRERAVVDNAVDVICSISSDGRFAKLSHASETLWGLSPQELIEHHWAEIIYKDDVERSMKWFEKMKSAEQSAELENRIVRKNGTVVHMLWSSYWSSSENSLFSVAHDITDRVELERLKKQFVEMISHDLRTPLNAVNSTLELLAIGAWGALTPQGHNKVEAAEENLRHSIDLINNLLDLDKMESGTMDLNLKEISLAALLQKCMSSVASLAEQRSIEITLPESDSKVMADERRLSQVVINLLGNALKFSPPGSCISLDLESESELVKVTISDQGSGIPESQKALIFERFHQVPEQSQKVQGTGLGLAICKAIVTAHGGTIGVESEIAKGSTFWFRLRTIPR